MSKIKHLTEADFDTEISEGVSFVALWAPWCGPCRMMAPVYEKVAEEIDGVKICKLNTDENPSIGAKFNVRSIPTLLFFRNGKLHESLLGAQSKSTIIDKLKELRD